MVAPPHVLDRPLDQIEADITMLEGEIAGLLKGLVA
jgi:hypothetical protein